MHKRIGLSFCAFVENNSSKKPEARIIKTGHQFQVDCGSSRVFKNWIILTQLSQNDSLCSTHLMLRVSMCGRHSSLENDVVYLKTDHKPPNDEGRCSGKKESNRNTWNHVGLYNKQNAQEPLSNLSYFAITQTPQSAMEDFWVTHFQPDTISQGCCEYKMEDKMEGRKNNESCFGSLLERKTVSDMFL